MAQAKGELVKMAGFGTYFEGRDFANYSEGG